MERISSTRLDKSEMVQLGRAYDLEDIKTILPHRDPFLMIDSIENIYEDEAGNKNTRHIIAKKVLTGNEYYFKGHFPGNPVMPGVIMIETMAQASAFGLYDYKEHGPDYQMLFMGCDKVKFKSVAKPGDELRIEIETLRYRASRSKMKGQIFNVTTGKVACIAEFMAASGTVNRPLFNKEA